MKKTLALVLVACMLTALLSVASFAVEEFSIPKATAAPTIDGVKSAGEWDGALCSKMTADNTYQKAGSYDDRTGEFYWMWDDKGVYLYVEVADDTAPETRHSNGVGSYNSGDGIQLFVAPEGSSGNGVGEIFFISIVIADDDTIAVGDHFSYGDGGSGSDIDDVVAAGSYADNTYKYEVFFPMSVWKDGETVLEVADGVTFAMSEIIMDGEAGDGATSLNVHNDDASGWFEYDSTNKYTFTASKTAGGPAAAPVAPWKYEADNFQMSFDTIWLDGEMVVDGNAMGYINDNALKASTVGVRGWAGFKNAEAFDLVWGYSINEGAPVYSEDNYQDRGDVRAAIGEFADGFCVEDIPVNADATLVQIWAKDGAGNETKIIEFHVNGEYAKSAPADDPTPVTPDDPTPVGPATQTTDILSAIAVVGLIAFGGYTVAKKH